MKIALSPNVAILIVLDFYLFRRAAGLELAFLIDQFEETIQVAADRLFK